jgi:prepilin-type N-terminal cleavage/methylation domain-containing protein
LNKLRTSSKSGFTIIELLVTISIIVVLVSTLALALTSARTAAQVAETLSRLTALKNATMRFKDDVGYYPAVLDTGRNLKTFPVFPGPITGAPQGMYRYQAQDWYSISSPAEFFLGYGNRFEDGYGRVIGSQANDPLFPDYEEMPRFGIRHPSMDGVWRATDIWALDISTGQGLFEERAPSTRGELIGPYLEIENDQMYGRLIPDADGNPMVDPITGQTKVFYHGDPELDAYTAVERQSLTMVIVDTWGSPIRYYRPRYPVAADPNLPLTGISRVYPQANNFDRPTLSDYIALRPYDFQPDKVIDGTISDFMNGIADPSGDRSTTIELQAGQFAYFSPGPDKQVNEYIRADIYGLPGNLDVNATQEVNEDNIVEIGP